MYCRKCGSKIPDGSEFCPKCGESQGVPRPSTSKDHRESLKDPKPSKKKPKKNPFAKFIKTITTIAIVLIVVLLAVLVTDYFDIIDYKGIIERNRAIQERKKEEDLDRRISESVHEIISEPDETPDQNAAQYFEERSSEITAVKPANESKMIETENEVVFDFSSRGIDQFEITSDYDKEGSYNETTVDESSNESHPLYRTYYVNKKNEMWQIYSINGQVVAEPLSYDLESERSARILFSEKDTITSYDSETNSFYETVPKEEELILIKVVRIDADLMEKYTKEELDNL